MTRRIRLSAATCIAIWGLFFVMSADGANAETGHIQIKSVPGVQVFLDGDLKGITKSNVGGLIIQDVEIGTHELKAVRDGYQTQTKIFTLETDQVFVHEFEWKRARMVIEESGEEADTEAVAKVGKLLLKSLPVECQIKIPDLDVDYSKSKETLTLRDVPVGTYAMTFSGMGKTLRKTVELNTQDEVTVFVNFLSGEIETTRKNLLEEEQERLRREEEELRARQAEEELAKVARLLREEEERQERERQAAERRAQQLEKEKQLAVVEIRLNNSKYREKGSGWSWVRVMVDGKDATGKINPDNRGEATARFTVQPGKHKIVLGGNVGGKKFTFEKGFTYTLSYDSKWLGPSWNGFRLIHENKRLTE